MPKISSKHQGRETAFSYQNFYGGYIEDQHALVIPVSQLSDIMNFKYSLTEVDGKPMVILKQRQGTDALTSTALSSVVKACFYYKNQSKYIIATTTQLYYLDAAGNPVLIGTIEGVPTFTEFNEKLIIHDGGVTKFWDGTTFGKINREYEDENLDTGDGVHARYSGTLGHSPVEAGTLDIEYTKTTIRTISDDGYGRLSETSITATITGITNANPAVVTAVAHGFLTGMKVLIQGVYGMIEVNGNIYSITKIGADSFSLNGVDSTLYGGYTSGGTTERAINIPITAISQTNPALVTALNHGFSDFSGSSVVQIEGVVGMTEVNNLTFTIAVVDDDSFQLVGIDSSGYTAYISGGTVTKNVIIYSTGVYAFTCSGIPDSATAITATYEHQDGAPKSKAGLVRQDQLYLWGDSDYPTRLWYSDVNYEKGWGTPTVDQYVGVETQDGYDLIGCTNFFQRILCIKQNATFHLVDFPGDTTFAIQPLLPNVGASAYRTVIPIGDSTFGLGEEGLVKILASDVFGDVQKELISRSFEQKAKQYANGYAFAAYNAMDGQYWLALADALENYLNWVYIVDTKLGLLSKYRFMFAHSCFQYVNDEMLIGGTDGHLYKLVDDESTFTDNGTSYDDYTYIQGAFSDWQMPNNRKHSKKFNLRISPKLGMNATLKIYINKDMDTPYATLVLASSLGWADISDGDVDIEDLAGFDIGEMDSNLNFPYRFTFDSLMWRLENISSILGIDVLGVDVKAAILGD